jgi:hypothetical protein
VFRVVALMPQAMESMDDEGGQPADLTEQQQPIPSNSNVDTPNDQESQELRPGRSGPGASGRVVVRAHNNIACVSIFVYESIEDAFG